MKIWLIGAGPMAIAYTRVLVALGVDFQVIGRGPTSAQSFSHTTGRDVYIGGVEAALQCIQPPTHAIVAVGVESLAKTATALIQAGVSQILLEKPGALDLAELVSLQDAANKVSAKVWVAYNRRYLSSTLAAEQIIKQDGGLTSMLFEFTEWSHVIEPLQKAVGVKEKWLLANSTHVIDLAFYFGGNPTSWQSWHAGSLDWHPASSRFVGAGITNRNVLFSYIADWEAPGRWSLELLTKKHRLILRPMEKLQITAHGSVKVDFVEIDDQLDIKYKPGIYRLVSDFISDEPGRLIGLDKQVEKASIYKKIAGYS